MTNDMNFNEFEDNGRLVVSIPTYPEFPEGGAKAKMIGRLDKSGNLVIETINVGSLHEGKGLGSALLNYLKQREGIESISANPSAEATEKGFYEKNGFELDSKNFFIWRKSVRV
ncbi:MAG TPA: GNAT family N-acetyltransferase [Patescibacteria group bacterium]|nr:GNAT family N-acetyltransferase [Patescibacteria group bacterium]